MNYTEIISLWCL